MNRLANLLPRIARRRTRRCPGAATPAGPLARLRAAAAAAVEPLESRVLMTNTLLAGHIYIVKPGPDVPAPTTVSAQMYITYIPDWPTAYGDAYVDESGFYEYDVDATLGSGHGVSSGPWPSDVYANVPFGYHQVSPDDPNHPDPDHYTQDVPGTYSGLDFTLAANTAPPNGTAPDLKSHTGGNPGNCGPCQQQGGAATSGAPVRYVDGQVVERAVDLPSEGSLPWGHSRGWSNNPAYATTNVNGNGWVVEQWPQLQATQDCDALAVVQGSTSAEWFDEHGTTSPWYTARHGSHDTLAYAASSGPGSFVYTDEQGGRTTFYDYDDSLPAAQQGAFESYTDPAGNTISVYSHDTAGHITEIRRTTAGGGTVDSYLYEYLASGANAGKLQRITYRRSTDSGSTWSTIRSVEYDYYGSGESYGNLGDLKTATIKDPSGAVIDQWYYRYWTSNTSPGYAGGLKYVFDPAACSRAAAALPGGTTLLTATDTQLAPYATKYYEYDSGHRISLEKASGTGCSSCSGGIGTYTFSYTASGNAAGYNSWSEKTIETLPDGNQNIVYTNYFGEAMLEVFKDNSTGLPTSGKSFPTFHHFDANGREDFTAHPSAFTPDGSGNLYNDTYADLLHAVSGNYAYLSDSSGLIDVTDYGTSTTAGTSTAGDVDGYVKDTKIRQGESGTAVLVTATSYFSHAGGGATIYPVASTTAYANTDGTGGRTTDYAYTWQGSTDQVASLQTKRPVVGTTENGPGGTDRDTTTDVYDAYGHVIWQKDPDGFITYFAYDPATGAMTKQITDVNTANTGDFANLPTGWATPTGGGLHLITSYAADALGRTTKVTDPKGNFTYTVYDDANHSTMVFPGWDATNHTTTGPVVVSREYRPAANAASGQRTDYAETLTTSAAPTYTGTSGSYVPSGVGTITAGNIQSLARSLTNDAGQTIEDDAYFSLSGVTYSQAAAQQGSASNDSSTGNYHATTYGFNLAGRQDRVVEPTGTITRLVIDGLGRVVSTWQGTDDTGATHDDPDGTGSPNNMKLVSEDEYDGGNVGDSNLTKLTLHPTGAASSTYDRVTQNFFDWRDRLVASKGGVQASETDTAVQRPIAYTDYDNLGEATAMYLYDGDGVSVTTTSGVPDKPSSSLLRAKSTAGYDEQGRVYQTKVFNVDQGNGTVSSSALTSNTFYDRRGNVIKSAAPGGLATKGVFDGAGRQTKQYATDGGGDSGWSDADDVTGDTVLTQTAFTYDADGNTTFATTKDRFHDASGTGELGDASTSPKARVTYAASYYDAANRPTDMVDVGTNGGSAYTRPGSAPSRDDTHLVTSYHYDSAGRQDQVTDPRGTVSQMSYDLLGRTTQTVAAYVDGTPSAADDQTTTMTYDGAGHTLTLTAVLPSSTHQTTQYVYGVTTSGGNDLSSNDLLKEVRYPDKTSGDAGTGSSDKQVYTYNAVGDPKTYTDQNQTVHTYTYDVLGRTLSDAAAVASGNPQNVDTSVLRLETAYDTAGRPYLFTSYNAASGGTVVNQVQDNFNGLGQLTAEYQATGGSVNTGTTPKVQYAYSEMAGGANHSRLTSMTYPNGRVLNYNYSSGIDDSISRLTYLSDGGGSASGTHLEELSYLGLSTVVKRAHPEPGVDLTYVKQTGEGNGDAGDQYTGLDRFGRVADQRWIKTSTGTATDRFQYGYDRDGDPLYKDNKVSSGFSELYHANGASAGYDALNRLTDFRRGTLSDANSDGVPDTVSTLNTLAGSQRAWSLDALGNWSSSTTDGTATSRTHDKRNELTAVGGTNLGFDYNGNTIADQTGKQFAYDAWNRLTKTKDNTGTLLETYSYDALGHRDVETPAGGGTATSLCYSNQWQVLEERQGSTVTRQNVWSPVYVDCLVLRDDNSTSGSLGATSSGLGRRLYAQQDANFNTTALLDTSGAVQERFVYDPYGSQTVLSGAWATTSDAYSWNYLHQGGRLDATSGLQDFRNRLYSPTLGRWAQQDPAGYVDGMNLYNYERDEPSEGRDPSGLTMSVHVNDAGRTQFGAYTSPKNFLELTLDALRAMCPCVSLDQKVFGNSRRIVADVNSNYATKDTFCDCFKKHLSGCKLLHDLLESTKHILIRYAQKPESQGAGPTNFGSFATWNPRVDDVPGDWQPRGSGDTGFMGFAPISNFGHELMHTWDSLYDLHDYTNGQGIYTPERWATEQRAVRTQNQIYSEMHGDYPNGGVDAPRSRYTYPVPGSNQPVFSNQAQGPEGNCDCEKLMPTASHPWGNPSQGAQSPYPLRPEKK